MARDWLKLHRSIVDTAFWHDDWLVRLWIWCLVKANYADANWRGMAVKRGEFITGRNTAADELGVSPSKWMRGIMRLVDAGCLKYEANSNWTRLTVCNYGTYQDADAMDRTTSGQVMTQRADNERTSDDTTSGQAVTQRADTREEEQEGKKVRTEFTHTHNAADWSHLSEVLQDGIERWQRHWQGTHGHGKRDTDIHVESMLMRAKQAGWSDDKIAESITLGIVKVAKSWLDPEADFERMAKNRANGRKASYNSAEIPF